MGVRLTGLSTPIGGLTWEYTESRGQSAPIRISPSQKLKVFISSICGLDKYDKVRAELRAAIEGTGLADVYTFESTGASTLPAGAHYTFALEESDICIFLIDNADGITPGVQVEIDTVKKYNIKALYYFCDETQKEKTPLEQSLMGAHFAKSKTVHSFSELSQDGAKALSMVFSLRSITMMRLSFRPKKALLLTFVRDKSKESVPRQQNVFTMLLAILRLRCWIRNPKGSFPSPESAQVNFRR